MGFDNHGKAAEDLAVIRQMMEAAGRDCDIHLLRRWFRFSGITLLLTGTIQILLGFLRNWVWLNSSDLNIFDGVAQASAIIHYAGNIVLILLYIQNRKKIKAKNSRTELQLIDLWFVALIIIPALFHVFRIIFSGIPAARQDIRILGLSAARVIITAFVMYITSVSLKSRNFMIFSIVYTGIVLAAQLFPVNFIAENDMGQSVFCLSDECFIGIFPGIFLLLLGLFKGKHNV